VVETWIHSKHDRSKNTKVYKEDVIAVRDCILRCCNSSWWEWDAGSRPLFWRWPAEYRSVIRDGLSSWKGPMTSYQVPQRAEKNSKPERYDEI
jgi:hypothetical protein